jgi:hypothetical protein
LVGKYVENKCLEGVAAIEGTTNMDVKETCWDMERFNLAQDRASGGLF